MVSFSENEKERDTEAQEEVRHSGVRQAEHEAPPEGNSEAQVELVEQAAREGLQRDPDAWCDAACEILVDLLRAHGITGQIEADSDSPGTGYKGATHSWVRLTDGTILDPTVSQFGGTQTVVPPEAPEQQNYRTSADEELWFPDVEDATVANQQALAEHQQTNHALLRPDVLEGALGRAQNYWYYEHNMAKAAAALAHGVGQAQAFEDGNKRTAFHLTHAFLTANGLGHTIPNDDQELADHLIGYGEGTHSMDDTANVLQGRIQGRTANILDPVHPELDNRVWDNPGDPEPHLKTEHRTWIWHTVFSVLADHGYDGMDNWLSLVLTGSLTTYQYSEESDCDVSLFVDTKVFPEWSRAEIIGVMISAMDGKRLPGTPHPMQCFVVSKTLTKDDLYKPGLRSGYDINLDQWIVPPDKGRVHDVEREMNEAYTTALEAADKMEMLLRYEPDKAKLYWHQIHKRRQRDQQAGKGDYAPSNITYKMLNNRGLFPQIAEATGEYIA
jgi:death-on-curing protein